MARARGALNVVAESGSLALPTPPPWAVLSRIPVAIFLDVDGTLLEFQSRPELVRATDGLVMLLRAVADRLDGALAVISGRPLDDLDRIFAPWQPYAAGVHGCQVRSASGVRSRDPDPSVLRELRTLAGQHIDPIPGAWVEDKGVGVALHYRGAPSAAASVAEVAATLIAATDGAFSVQPGSFVLELRPTGCDKGTAVRELVEGPPFAGRRPVVVGDDLTDEDAFRAAQEVGGDAVLVGDRADTCAGFRLPDPAAVRGWLTELLEEVRV